MNETDTDRTELPATYLEPHSGDATLSAYGFKALDTPVNIRVISYRKLRHDPDGISAKAVIDGLVHAGILADDTSEQVKKVTFESRKSKEEKTVIEITENTEQCPDVA